MPKRQRRSQGGSSRKREDPLDVLCRVFEWNRNTISSTHNRKDPDKPYVFWARTKSEAISNEVRLKKVRGEGDSYAAGTWFGLDDPPVRPTRKRHRQKVPKARLPDHVDQPDPVEVNTVNDGGRYGGPPDWNALRGPKARRRRKRKAKGAGT